MTSIYRPATYSAGYDSNKNSIIASDIQRFAGTLTMSHVLKGVTNEGQSSPDNGTGGFSS